MCVPAELYRHTRDRARAGGASISFNDALKAPTDRYDNDRTGRGTFAARVSFAGRCAGISSR